MALPASDRMAQSLIIPLALRGTGRWRRSGTGLGMCKSEIEPGQAAFAQDTLLFRNTDAG